VRSLPPSLLLRLQAEEIPTYSPSTLQEDQEEEEMSVRECPECKVTMDTVTEQGICIDRCRICHGVFLDKGELEHLRMAATKSEGGFDFGSFVLGGLLF